MTAGAQIIGEPKSLRKKAFGELVGVSPGRVSQMVAAGLPVEPDGRINVAAGKLWIKGNISPTRSAAQAAQGDLPFAAQLDAAAEHARLAKERADTQALKNAQLRKELLPAEEVERAQASEWRALRASLLALPSRLRQLLPHLSAEDVDMIDAELRRTMTDFASG